MSQRTRWRYVVLPGLQWRFVFFIFWVLLVSVVVIGWDVYYSSSRIFMSGLSDPHMIQLLHETLGLLSVKLVLYVCIVASISLLVSHRIAGPLYHLEKSMELVAESGDLTQRVRLRQADELQHVADSFNEMLESLQRRAKNTGAFYEGLARELEALAREVRSSNPRLADEAQALAEKLACGMPRFTV